MIGTARHHNQSLYWPSAASLNMPCGVAAAGDRLLVADTANSRLLSWAAVDCVIGAPACALTGQPDFAAKGDNRWHLPVRSARRRVLAQRHRPGRGLTVIADSGNNRVLLRRRAAGQTS